MTRNCNVQLVSEIGVLIRELETQIFPGSICHMGLSFRDDCWHVRIEILSPVQAIGHVINAPGVWLDKAIATAFRCAHELAADIARDKAAIEAAHQRRATA